MHAKIILPVAFLLAGCASAPRLVYVVPQPTAPVEIIKVIPGRENLLAYVTVRNNTDRYVQDFTITWIVFRPVGCAMSGPAPWIGGVMMTSVQAHAEQRGTGTLPTGAKWGDRVLLPHEETKISTALFLTEASLRELAEKYNAKKLRVQIGVAYADFTEGNKFSNHNGPPDWSEQAFQRTQVLDQADAAAQACM